MGITSFSNHSNPDAELTQEYVDLTNDMALDMALDIGDSISNEPGESSMATPPQAGCAPSGPSMIVDTGNRHVASAQVPMLDEDLFVAAAKGMPDGDGSTLDQCVRPTVRLSPQIGHQSPLVELTDTARVFAQSSMTSTAENSMQSFLTSDLLFSDFLSALEDDENF